MNKEFPVGKKKRKGRNAEGNAADNAADRRMIDNCKSGVSAEIEVVKCKNFEKYTNI